MAGNHLEDLVAEWYQFQGFFVRRNIQVGKRPRGGYECELDVVAFHPAKRQLLHIEPSLDSDSWERREERYQKKFEAGRRYIPALFTGLEIPKEPDQIALFVYGARGQRTGLAGGKIVLIREFMNEILSTLRGRRVAAAAIPEEFPLLRTLQFAAQYWEGVSTTTTTENVVGPAASNAAFRRQLE
ncbi:MAG TPA: hypothetical protein VN643_16255 [Pyrinomonadaceae bacterium]|nr:hypothetical protein [Pyrinomonadaceae bacterium]